MADNELDFGAMEGDDGFMVRELADAIDNASDQGRMTWITSGGKRIAAIVPVSDVKTCLRHLEPLQTVSVRWHTDGSECK